MGDPIDELPSDECHVWLARAPDVVPSAVARRYEAWLTEDEWRRYQSFRFERHRNLFLLTRALVRSTLSRYAAVPPASWRFALGSHGKPHIGSPHAARLPSFNLSNTDGLVACAVAHGVDVGVDVEQIERLDDPMSVADRFFSPREVADLLALPAGQRRQRFFAYWTLKEAYIKARGLGLAIPLDQFSFLLSEDEPDVGLVVDERLGDDAGAWQCERIAIAPPHALALLLRRASAPNLLVRVREVDLISGRAESR